jgi:Skp family chaperone for outer membrane proteins
MLKTLLVTIPIVVATTIVVSALRQTPDVGQSQIAFISVQRVLTESADGKAELAKLQGVQQTRTTELRAKQSQLEATRNELMGASLAARGQLQNQEQQQRTELERLTVQSQVELQNVQRQINSEMMVKVKRVLDTMLKGRNVQAVLSADAAVVWGRTNLDLTSAVIAQLNAASAAAPDQAK